MELTYNLMRTFVAAFAFVLPFSLADQMSVDRLKKNIFGKKRYIPAAAGMTAGLGVSIAGNMHYVVYSKIIPSVDTEAFRCRKCGQLLVSGCNKVYWT